MSRPRRVTYDGAIYHVYQRGNNKDFIFESPYHKNFFIKQLKEYNKRFDYQILAYVIMSNHYHLLIKTNKDPITQIMFNINNVTSKFLNRELNRSGHIYEDRYKCKIVENHSYLLWLLRYIHRNPIRAGLCSDMKAYKWCSHIFYNCNLNDFIDINFILDILSSNRFIAIKQYSKLMNALGCDYDNEVDFSIIKENYYLKDTLISAPIEHTYKINKLSLDDILNSIKIPPDLEQLIKEGHKNKNLIPYKILFLKEALNNKYSLVDISKFLNTTPDALRKFKNYHKIST